MMKSRTTFLSAALMAALLNSVAIGSATEKQDIVTTAVSAGSFKTLAAALDAAGLVETLQGEGPFTVFAPTDEAFAALPEGTVEELLKPENKAQLVNILTYHVVAGSVPAAVVTNLRKVPALYDQEIKVRNKQDRLLLNKSKVTQTDIACTNGVIHVIDAVLLPPEAVVASQPDDESATDIIMAGIEKGVPVYNSGNAQGCATIYQATAMRLLDTDTLADAERRMLRAAMDRASNSHDHMANAWMYRNLFDRMLANRH